jgi:K+-transporting ATPase A subunit
MYFSHFLACIVLMVKNMFFTNLGKNEEHAKKWEKYIVGVIDLIIRKISISTLKVQTLPKYNFSRKTDFGNDHMSGPGKG